mmetsp:Transcript_34796/g.81581  ORF Transcript_34796/g.81581 Transcript_34796/m.81581 type:complete len:336 (+) Transcript_34796:962-1969(+)
MGCPVVRNRIIDVLRVDLADAHAGAPHRSHRPGEAPPVAVEHRERPKVSGMVSHVPPNHVGQRIEVCPPVVRYNAFRVSCGARGVPQCDRVPFIGRGLVLKRGVPFSEKRVKRKIADRLLWGGVGSLRVDKIHHQDVPLDRLEGLLHRGGELRIDNDDTCLGVGDDEGNRGGVQARVEGIDHCTSHRDGPVTLKHLGGVAEHDRDGVSWFHAPPDEGACEPPAPLCRLPPCELLAPVHARDLSGICPLHPLEKGKGGELSVVCLCLGKGPAGGRGGRGEGGERARKPTPRDHRFQFRVEGGRGRGGKEDIASTHCCSRAAEGSQGKHGCEGAARP